MEPLSGDIVKIKLNALLSACCDNKLIECRGISTDATQSSIGRIKCCRYIWEDQTNTMFLLLFNSIIAAMSGLKVTSYLHLVKTNPLPMCKLHPIQVCANQIQTKFTSNRFTSGTRTAKRHTDRGSKGWSTIFSEYYDNNIKMFEKLANI